SGWWGPASARAFRGPAAPSRTRAGGTPGRRGTIPPARRAGGAGPRPGTGARAPPTRGSPRGGRAGGAPRGGRRGRRRGGGGAPARELLAASRLGICAEISLPVHHCLLARRDGTLAGLRRVVAHPQALAQCRRWLAEHLPTVVTEAETSNARAAERARS